MTFFKCQVYLEFFTYPFSLLLAYDFDVQTSSAIIQGIWV